MIFVAIFFFTVQWGKYLLVIGYQLNGYLLYGKRLKREICFRRNEILFYAEIQQKFTYLTSEASSIIEFELNFGIIKNFIESKKFHVEDCFSIQHATFCHSNQHCGTSLSVFTQKKAKKNGKKCNYDFRFSNCEIHFSYSKK